MSNTATATRKTITLTDQAWWVRHSDTDLRSIADRYTADSLFMSTTAPALADEAMAIANAAWAELTSRGVK